MTIDERISSFARLGELLRRFPGEAGDSDLAPLAEAAMLASAENGWFTPTNIKLALHSLGEALDPQNLKDWIDPYRSQINPIAKTIGVVMAGNIPAVGFHDFLCVLISGNRLSAKLSAGDARLIPAMARILEAFNPAWKESIRFTTGKLDSFDAIIATGSNNASRYFDLYFGKYPHIIRRNRNSLAILNGSESLSDLEALADDLLQYFGLGCRNVSKVYIPESFDLKNLIKPFSKYDDLANHHKYRNNYDYMKSIYLINQVPFLDTGSLLITENHSISSPISVLYFERYHHQNEVVKQIVALKDEIQCVVSTSDPGIGFVKPGTTQRPGLKDYADDVDTMKFLLEGIS